MDAKPLVEANTPSSMELPLPIGIDVRLLTKAKALIGVDFSSLIGVDIGLLMKVELPTKVGFLLLVRVLCRARNMLVAKVELDQSSLLNVSQLDRM